MRNNINNFNNSKKLSVDTTSNNSRKSILKHDTNYEYDAPKFFDFTKDNKSDLE